MSEIGLGILSTIFRSLGSIVILQILTKIVGARQISQLSFYDYIVGITVGSIAAVMAVDDSIPWQYPAVAMIVYMVITYFEAIVTTKSLTLRKILTGTPTILIYNGKIIEKNLKKVHYDINDLLTECRCNGYFNLDSVHYAVMETNGKVSFLLKSDQRPLTPYDMNITPAQETMYANVVIDGVIMEHQLHAIGKDVNWFHLRCKELHLKHPDQMLLAIADCDNNLYAYYTEEELKDKHYFI